MKAPLLTRAELNRATLARQLLLERETLAVPEAVARLAGLQAQVPGPPFVGLWSRLEGFAREALVGALERREVVRATAMRSTIHILTAEDYLALRRTLEPALMRALVAFNGERARRLDADRVVAAARRLVEERPRARGELIKDLGELWSDESPEAMAYLAQSRLPLVQLPGAGPWGFAQSPPYALAEAVLGRPPAEPDVGLLLRRYLAAFGPASIRDFQAWSGLTRMKDAAQELGDGELVVYRDEEGRELLDLPGAPRPPAATAAPVRFLPDYDNLVLSHADRTRVLPDEHRKQVLLGAGRVRATILVDGTVRGAWKLEKKRREAVVRVEAFGRLTRAARNELTQEGEALARLLAPEAESLGVAFD